MITKLISSTEFVNIIDELVQRELEQSFDDWKLKQLGVIKRYTQFLLQPLTLSMFVPVDDEGNFLKEPMRSEILSVEEEEFYKQEQYCYEKAKSKVLFEGFHIVKFEGGAIFTNDKLAISVINNKMHFDLVFEQKTPHYLGKLINIQDLTNYDLTLTETAIKQIYG